MEDYKHYAYLETTGLLSCSKDRKNPYVSERQFEIKTVDISYEKSISLYFPLTIVIIYQTASEDRTERDSNNGYYTKIW